MHIASSFNIIVAVLVAALVAGGILLGEVRIRALAIGLFVGFFSVLMLPESVVERMPSLIANLPSNLLVAYVIAALFVAASFLGQRKAKRSFRSIFLSVATALFAVAFSLTLLPAGSREELVTEFNLAAMTYNFRIYILLAEVAILIVFSAFSIKSKEEKKGKKGK